MIHRTPFFLPYFYPSLIWRVPTSRKELYLTFDDGPVSGPTEFVLETLSERKAHATFFCIGDNIQKHPCIFQKLVTNGHTVGNHTFNHLNGWRTSNETYISNIEKCQEQIYSGCVRGGESNSVSQQHVSKHKFLFRPPYGCITYSQIKILNQFQIVMWDVLSVDYDKTLSPEACLKNTIRACRPGSIIVFHDSFKAERNMMYALPRFMDHFSERDFVFKAFT